MPEAISLTELEQNTAAPRISRKDPTEEFKWKLKYAHLYQDVNWIKELDTVSELTKSARIYEFVLRHIREYPLDIFTKKRLLDRSRNVFRALTRRRRTRSFKNSSIRTMRKIQEETSTSLGFRGSGFSVLALWGDTIGHITAYYGTNVASYFDFLRFLFQINILMGVLMFLFVSLPQIIPGEVMTYDVMPAFFGDLSSTIFFYGAYSNFSIGHGAVIYKRPLAFLITWSCSNFLAVLIIVISMYIKYRRIKGYNSGDSEPYSSRLFFSWDYSITSKDGVNKMAGFIVNYFKETIQEEKFESGLTHDQRVNLWIKRIFCNLFSVGVLAGSCYLIYFVAEHTITPNLAIPTVVNDFILKYQLPLLVSLMKVFIPPFLSLLLYIERYHPRTQIKVRISRTAVFYIANLVVFLASIYSLSIKCVGDVSGNSTSMPYCCWENEVGEQLFQMVILDLILCFLVGVFFTGGKTLLYKVGILRKFGQPDFDVASRILDLVYGQSLIWLGLFAAPFFALVALVKLIILFYFNYGLVKGVCDPNNVFRASRSGTFYLFILLITHFVCLFPLTYAIIKLNPSASCGPFRTRHRVYEVLTNEIGVSPDWFYDVLEFCSSPAFIIPLIIVLVLLALYYKARASTLHSEAKELRHHLEFERNVGKRKIYATAMLISGTPESVGLIENGKVNAPAALRQPGRPEFREASEARVRKQSAAAVRGRRHRASAGVQGSELQLATGRVEPQAGSQGELSNMSQQNHRNDRGLYKDNPRAHGKSSSNPQSGQRYHDDQVHEKKALQRVHSSQDTQPATNLQHMPGKKTVAPNPRQMQRTQSINQPSIPVLQKTSNIQPVSRQLTPALQHTAKHQTVNHLSAPDRQQTPNIEPVYHQSEPALQQTPNNQPLNHQSVPASQQTPNKQPLSHQSVPALQQTLNVQPVNHQSVPTLQQTPNNKPVNHQSVPALQQLTSIQPAYPQSVPALQQAPSSLLNDSNKTTDHQPTTNDEDLAVPRIHVKMSAYENPMYKGTHDRIPDDQQPDLYQLDLHKPDLQQPELQQPNDHIEEREQVYSGFNLPDHLLDLHQESDSYLPDHLPGLHETDLYLPDHLPGFHQSDIEHHDGNSFSESQ